MPGFLDAHGYDPGPSQRPLIAGGISGLLATVPAIAILVAAGSLKVEAEVLGLVARGYTNRQIAAALVISVKTASVHVSHILRKLDAPNRLEAATIAHRLSPREER